MTQESFNLDDLDADVASLTFRVAVVVDIDGNDKSGFVIVSKDSAQYQEAAKQIRIDGLQRSSKRKTLLDTSTVEGATAVAKIIHSNDVALAASVIVDWFGFGNKGAAAAFDKATAVKLLDKFPTWREKVLAALEADANFTAG